MNGISAPRPAETDVFFSDTQLSQKVTFHPEFVGPVMPPMLKQTHIDQPRIVPRAGTMPDPNVFDALARFQSHTTIVLR